MDTTVLKGLSREMYLAFVDQMDIITNEMHIIVVVLATSQFTSKQVMCNNF